MARLSPLGPFRALDNNGNPLSGGKLITYEAGTTTPKATFTDESGDTANPNPVILDSAGYADVWLDTGAYKFVLTDSADVTIWTIDNVSGDSSNAFAGSVVSVSTNLNVNSVYRNSVLVCSAALTLSLIPATTAEEGFVFTVYNNGLGNVILDPDSTETINGETSATLFPGQSGMIICDGSQWFLVLSSSDTLQNLTAVSDPTVTDDADAGYSIGSIWFNTTSKEYFICTDNTVGSAEWQNTTLSVGDLGALAVLNSISFSHIDSGAIASQAEAEAGTASDKLMTPQRTAEAISAQNTVTASSFIDFASSYTLNISSNVSRTHGLGAVPDSIITRLVCISASQGYSVGDIIYINGSNPSEAGSNFGFSIEADSTTVVCVGGSDNPVVFRKDTNTVQEITAGNWKLQFKAIIF